MPEPPVVELKVPCLPAPTEAARTVGGSLSPRASNAQSAFRRVVKFGPFRLHTSERTLEKDGLPVKIGSRAFDLLVALIEHAPEVVSKRELLARAWGTSVVEEGSLRLQIACLRRVLGDGSSGVRHITNVPGRGYCFVALDTPVDSRLGPNEIAAPSPAKFQLPRRPTRVFGRDDAIHDLTRQLREQRFLSIVGTGGIGKTTVALAIAHEMLSEFAGAVYFLDLAAIKNAEMVETALATLLGVSVVSETPLPAILSSLGEQRVLLLLDSCEHLIEPVAWLAEELFRGAPQVHLLLTSREPLRAEGEWVHHLPPLQCPPRDNASLTAAQALSFPAVQLFVEQVEATGYPLELSDADAPIVADLCRRLDGIALALELAARYVGVYGIKGTAALLDHQFNSLRGRRTATPRHQTLTAALDWSHGLLSEPERLVLRRLAIFVGAFSLEAATAVIADALDATQTTETLARLVEKSLLTLDVSAATRYRLLDTTRAYAAQKLATSGEQNMTARRLAEYISSVLERFEPTMSRRCSTECIDFFVAQIGNVRAALTWSFGDDGDIDIGTRLVAAAAPLFFELSLLTECITWSERVGPDVVRIFGESGEISTHAAARCWPTFPRRSLAERLLASPPRCSDPVSVR